MDDGTPSGAGLKIATNSFKQEDVLFLCDVLNKKYNLYARPHRDREQFVIYIPKGAMPLLGPLISPYLVPSMHRKLNGYYVV
jgi:LAGLIDADG DNA endonuclease family